MSLEELNSKYNIFVTIAKMKIRDKGKLHGLKFGVKDVIMTRGIRTTAGSKILKDFIPNENAYIVNKILEEGGEIVGKTNTHEFAMGATNTSSLIGPAKNPIDPERISGGSSGGSAVAVALDLVDIGIGTDTGGSIRIPAALCGVIGFKPTTGLLPTDGIIPFSWTFDTVGFLAKDINKIRKVMEAVTENKIPLVTHNKRRPTLGLFLFEDYETSRALNSTINKLSSYFDIIEIKNDMITKYSGEVRKNIALAEGSSYHLKYYKEYKDEYFNDVRKLIESGFQISAVDYVNALRLRKILIEEYFRIFKKVDALLSPTTRIVAPKISEVIGNELKYRDSLIANTEIFNTVGAPSISLPVTSLNGLPVGLMISGEPFKDGSILDLAEEILGIVGFIK
ncbi:amidase [Sulfurisphaera javensis]|uniref:Amidase n=1 Tax=Sulfurisphaera javensis TaxID=2049879 RepID=A0AAT9GRV4_9CREN